MCAFDIFLCEEQVVGHTGDRWQDCSFSMSLTGGRGVLIVIGTEGPQLKGAAAISTLWQGSHWQLKALT